MPVKRCVVFILNKGDVEKYWTGFSLTGSWFYHARILFIHRAEWIFASVRLTCHSSCTQMT